MLDIPTHLRLKYDCIINGVSVSAGTIVKLLEIRSKQFYPEYLIEAFSETPSAGRRWLPYYMVEKIEPLSSSGSETSYDATNFKFSLET